MAKKALIFPGQGSQYPGLGKKTFDLSPLAEKTYNMLDDLGFDLSINNDENINDQKNEDDNLSENDNQKNPEKDKGDDQSEDVSQDSSDKSIVDGDEKGEGDQGEDYEGSYQSSKLESLTKYKAYTREFDEIIEANKLCDFQELEKLRNIDPSELEQLSPEKIAEIYDAGGQVTYTGLFGWLFRR